VVGDLRGGLVDADIHDGVCLGKCAVVEVGGGLLGDGSVGLVLAELESEVTGGGRGAGLDLVGEDEGEGHGLGSVAIVVFHVVFDDPLTTLGEVDASLRRVLLFRVGLDIGFNEEPVGGFNLGGDDAIVVVKGGSHGLIA